MKAYIQHSLQIGLVFATLFFASCASVPMASEQQRASAASFRPAAGEAILYVYRESGFIGSAVAHPVYVDGRILGNNGPGTFLFTSLTSGHHVIGAGVSQVPIDVIPNHVYFIRQSADITMSGTLHTSSVRLVSEDEGRRGVAECKQASAAF